MVGDAKNDILAGQGRRGDHLRRHVRAGDGVVRRPPARLHRRPVPRPVRPDPAGGVAAAAPWPPGSRSRRRRSWSSPPSSRRSASPSSWNRPRALLLHRGPRRRPVPVRAGAALLGARLPRVDPRGEPPEDPRDGAAPRRGGGGGLFPFLAGFRFRRRCPRRRGAVPISPSLAAHLLLLTALPEEVFFRGYLYDAFEEAGWEPMHPDRPAVRRGARGALPLALPPADLLPRPAVRVGPEKLGEHLRPDRRPFHLQPASPS